MRSVTLPRPGIGCRNPVLASWGDGEPKTGAHGRPVLFLHPKDFDGVLVELEEA